MTKTKTLSISLSPVLADEISKRVDSGLYSSASELIREAVRLLLRTEAREQIRPRFTREDLEKFMEFYENDNSQQPTRPFSDNDIREEAAEHLRQEVPEGFRLSPERLKEFLEFISERRKEGGS